MTMPAPESWSTPREGIALVLRRATLRRTIPITVFVGTMLSLINQADVVAAGAVTTTTWLRVGANYVVPFCVSSAGFLSACRLRRS